MKVSRSSVTGSGRVLATAAGELRRLRGGFRRCLHGAAAAILLLSMPVAHAQIQNGGFESGDFSSWTLRDYRRGNSTIPVTSSADLGLTEQGAPANGGNGGGFRSAVLTTGGFAPNTGSNLRYPLSGAASGRLGGSGAYGATSMEQVATMALSDVDPVDGKVHVRFAMAPVLNNPGHPSHQQPFFFVEVINQTKSTTMFTTFNYSNQPGIPWQSVGSYQFTNWQGFDISPGNGLLDVGDQVLIRVYVSNCAQGASDHTAQVYVDAFGSRMPGLSVSATGPSITKPGEEATYTYNYVNNSGVMALDSRVRVAAPITENGLHLEFVPGSWPASCTGPHAGTAPRADYIDCPVGDLNDGAGGSFDVAYTVPAGAATASPNNIVNNGDYDIRASTVSPFIGPLVKTTILPAATPTVDLGIAVDNGGHSSYVVGGPVAYTVTVTNHGPEDVEGAVITQTLSGVAGAAAWTCAPAAGSSASCADASGTGPIATTGDLPVGQSLVFTVDGITAATAGTTVVTVVNVAPPGGYSDSVAGNNTDGLSVSVSAEQHRLTVNTSGGGTGKITATPASLACPSPGGTDCSSQLLGEDQEAYLNAVADPGSVFKHWEGCTDSTGNQCYVKMGLLDVAVNAVFAKVWSVTPSIDGGSISPADPAIVEDGDGVDFTIVPGTAGEIPAIGTPGAANACPGVLSGPDGSGQYTFSIGPVTEDCAFDVTFTTPEPSLSLETSVVSPGPYGVGDSVDYEFVVTNTGNVPLTGITVDDALLDGAAACPVATLAPDESTTCTGSHTVTAAEVAAGYVQDSATAAGTPPTGPAVSSPASVVYAATEQNPELTLATSVSSTGPYTVGDAITYEFVVANTGDVTLDDVAVVDAQLDDEAVCGTSTLEPGESTTCTGSHTVTAAEVAAGYVHDSATATGQPPTPPGGTTPPTVDSAPSEVDTATAQSPSLSISQSVTSTGPYTTGDAIAYVFVVANTGDVTLVDIAVVDAQLDDEAVCAASTLEPGESTTCTGSHTVTAAEVAAGYVHDSATATGQPPTPPGGTTPPAIDSAPSEVDTATAQSPSLTISQSVTSAGPYTTGDAIAYEFVVANTGDVTLSGIVVNDAQLDDAAVCAASTLAPGESTTCTGSHTVTAAEVAAGYVHDSATATGQPPTPPGGTAPSSITSAASELDTATEQNPSLSITQSVTSSGPYTIDSTIAYEFVVANTGDVTLSGIVVNDAQLDDAAVCAATTLAPGESTTCTGSHTVAAAEVAAGYVHDSATATGQPPALPGGTTPPTVASAPSEVDTATEQNPSLSITQSVTSTGPYTAGSTIAYEFVVANTGDVTLADIAVNDAQLDEPAVCATTTLAPGESTSCTGTYTVTEADVEAGSVQSSATASGTPPAAPGGPVPAVLTSAAHALDIVIAQNPAIATAKAATLEVDNASPGKANIGDVIRYEVTVTNIGDVALDDVSVEDTLEGYAPTMLACAPTTLAPGETATCASYTHTVTVEDANRESGILDNRVLASANHVAGGNVAVAVSATDSAQVEVEPDPIQIRLVMSATPHDVKIGDLVRYTLVVQNTGTTPLVDGTIVGTPPAGFSYVDRSLVAGDVDESGQVAGIHPLTIAGIDLPAGHTATVTYLLRVGAGVRAGLHTNSALVRAGSEIVSNVASASVQLVADPMLDESLVLGTVFDDRDGDGWQDSAALAEVMVRGGFAAGAYVAGSTTVARGDEAQPQDDAEASLLRGIALGALAGRESEADPAARRRVVVGQTLSALEFTDDFLLTSAEGVTVRMDAAGNTTVERSGRAARGLGSAAPTVARTVSQVAHGYRVEYVIENQGIDERGIPGVRIASVEGLLVETDQYGRFHLTGVDGGRWERGRNFILKVDPATLPPGSGFTTENPRLRRVTPGLPVRFDFGVKLPSGLVEGGSQAVELELGEVVFDPGSAALCGDCLPVVDEMAAQVRAHGAGEVLIAASGEQEALAYERAKAVREALLARLDPALAQATTVSLRTDLADPGSTLLSLRASPVLGTVLFDTGKATIRSEFTPVIESIAADLEALGGGVVGITGHADRRGPDAGNAALGLRRAKAVYEAIAARLGAEARRRLRVEINDDPTAPAGATSR